MITAFVPSDPQGLRQLPHWKDPVPGDGTCWVDVVEATRQEIEALNTRYGIQLAYNGKSGRGEFTSRLNAVGDNLLMTFRTLPSGITETAFTEVICVLRPTELITVRSDDSLDLDLDHMGDQRTDGDPLDVNDMLFTLLSAQLSRLTEALESLGQQTDALLSEVFFASTKARRSARILRETLHELGRIGSQTAKVQDCLISLERLSMFLSRHTDQAIRKERHRPLLNTFHEELRSLGEYARGLDGKIDFLLNALIGFVGLDQNQVMKTVTMVAALFLPGTLISSIFGMNFIDMPAIHWHYGFIAAIGASGITALVLGILFRKLRWM